MVSGDTILFTLILVSGINVARYISTLRTLLVVMREAHPLLYQQVDGRGFFTSHGNVSKQVRLFHYLRYNEHLHHHDPIFVTKCSKVKRLFVLTSALILLTIVMLFAVLAFNL
ncbi:universal stress protein UspB [Aliivibrio kagoshimensis]|jgi:universal stress protein B|uniref:universal stress protein UspB n=1 Tax=Aliivibrio kagoshimensis TaxID=2910230 RepID=UPI003D0C4A56